MSEDGTTVVVEDLPVSPIECPEGKVPGWLDENGNPQGCVDNNPTPGVPKEDIPVITDPPVTDVPVDVVAPVVPSDVTVDIVTPVVPSHIETGMSVSATPDILAETGMNDPLGGLILGVVLVGVGITTSVRAYVLGKC